jgi:hypothetical protein
MNKNSFLTFGKTSAGVLALLLSLSAAYAEDKPSAVSGVSGVKQDAIDRIKPVTEVPPPPPQAVPPPPPTAVAIKPVTQTPPPPPPPTAIDIKPVTQTPPPPPPPTAVDIKPVTQTPPPPPPPTGVEVKPVTQTPPPPPPTVNKIDGVHTPPPPPPPVSAVNHVGSIQAVNGVTGLNTTKLKNLEAALVLKQAAETPKGDDAEHSGKGKAAAAALLAAPLDKVPPKPPKEDGRAGFHEFEKLQNRGS